MSPKKLTLLTFLIFLFASAASAQVVINEVLYRTDSTSTDPLQSKQWLELFNKGDASVDLAGWTISGRGGSGGTSARPLPSATLPSHAYLVIHFATGNNSATDYYTQDTANVLNPDTDEAALYSKTGIVDFISWYDMNQAYAAGNAGKDALAAKIWTLNAALFSDGIQAKKFEKPRPVEIGMAIGRDPDSTDTDTTADFEPHGGVGALDNSPGRQNLDSIKIVEVDPPVASSSRSGLQPADAAPVKKKWTVLLYFNGDNSLEYDIYGNIQEVAFGGSRLTRTAKPGSTGGSDANVNFVLMYDGKRFSQGTQRGLIRGDGDPNAITLERALGQSAQIGERDMADPNELAGFIAWAKSNYPAEHYALILSAHGDGWKGWGPDESSFKGSDTDSLYMGELLTGLGGQYLDLIGFDSCLMAGIEVADQLTQYTSYLLASEEVIPGYGFPYNTFSAALKSNPGWAGLDLGKNIVGLYAARYAKYSGPWTLSLTDIEALRPLVQQVDTWSGQLKLGASLFQGRDNPTDNGQVLIKFDRYASTQFNDGNYVDLYDLAQHINQDINLPDCTKGPIPFILNLISTSVVLSEAHSPRLPNAHGIHIYFPRNRKSDPESDDDYDSPETRATDGDSHYATYASSNDMLPLKARDREDRSQLNPRTEWPEPPSPNLFFVTDTGWSRFLERFYHPVADNHILKGVTSAGVVIDPVVTSAVCSNGADSISVPVGSTVYLSAAGSSDADQADFQFAPNLAPVPNLFLPSFYFWDLDSTTGCINSCNLQPQTVPAGTPADTAVTNMDADRDLINTNFDQKDAAGITTSRTCLSEGTFVITLMAWDDNHLKFVHNTIPDASYVHPQTDSHQSTITCTGAPPPPPGTNINQVPLTASIPVSFTVTNDPFDSSSFVNLLTGNLTATFSGLGAQAGHARAAADLPALDLPNDTGPQVSLTGDPPELVPAHGTFNTATNSFDIQGTSTGLIAGFSNVQARYTLTLSGANLSTISGTYQVGLNSTLNNETQPVTYSVTGTLKNQTYPPSTTPAITAVNTIYGKAVISQNDFISIQGNNLVPATTPAAGVIWSSAPEFASGHMPTQLGGVSVTVNGKPAFVYFYCSASTSAICKVDQLNILTPLDNTAGPVSVVVTSGTTSSPAFTVNMQAVSPSFLEFMGDGYVTATHADGSLLGPSNLYPGLSMPASPGETVVLYAAGFGLPSTPLVNGSSSQSGMLPSLPVCTVGNTPAPLTFAGLVEPGLYQLNLIVPLIAATSEVSCTYAGTTTVAGNLITIQPH